MAGLLRRYDAALQAWPRLTKTVTATAIACAGDVACQAAQSRAPAHAHGAGPEPQLQSWDSDRTKRFAVFTAFMTPLVHHWYLFLGRRFAHPLARVAADQLLWAPVGTAWFVYAMRRLEGHSHAEGVQGVQAKLGHLITANWTVWVPFQWLNFSFVPARYQVLAVNGVSFAWNIFLSNVLHEMPEGDAPDEVLAERQGEEQRVVALKGQGQPEATSSSSSTSNRMR